MFPCYDKASTRSPLTNYYSCLAEKRLLVKFTMPTPEQRLDQLEPIISEMLAKLDETAAKVERVSAQVRQLTVTFTNVLATQSGNIEFLLTRTQHLVEGQVVLEQGQAKLEQGQVALKQQVNQGFAQIIALLDEKLK